MNIKELRKVGLEIRFCNPLSIFNLDDFSYLYNDTEFQKIAKEVSLYFVLQRPCILFRNLIFSKDSLSGEIYQPYTNSCVKFFLHLYQDDVVEGDKRNLEINISVNEYIDNTEINSIEDFNNIEVLTFKESDENGGAHIKAITPDTILERYYTGSWKIIVEGDISPLLSFEVVYIGHSVKQFIAERIRSHSNIQRMLTQRKSIQQGMHIAKELCICLLQIDDIYDMRNLSSMDKKERLNFLLGKSVPSDNQIYYDAEKAFIKYFDNDRLENVKKYENYPMGTDGLFEENFPIITYSINEEINLMTNGNSLKCGRIAYEAIVVNRNDFQLTKITTI